jgi:type I restriction enzyme S subunit
MNADRLLEHFERISDAPDAVDRLRSLVFTLAHKGRLLADGCKTSWHTTTVGEVATEIKPGLACAKSHQQADGCVHLRTHNVATNGRMNFDLLVRVDPRRLDAEKRGLKKGDILFNNTNSQELVGKTCLVHEDNDFAFSNHLTRIRLCNEVDPAFLVNYFLNLLRTGFFARLCNRWIGQAGINTTALKAVPLSVPPLAEQHRIVAKVDELMALCDRLEAAQAEREARRDRLVSASLARVTEPHSDDATSMAPSARFHLDHFARLTTRPEHVKQLRQTILNLAVRGRLVPQDTRDAPVATLLTAIASAKAGHAANGRTKTTVRSISQLAGTDVPWPSPTAWAWCRFGDVVISRDSERVPVSKEERSTLAKTYDYYGASGVIDKLDRFLFDKPLLLIGEDGANLVNRSTPIAFMARGKYWVNNHAHVLDGVCEDMLRFLELHINAIDLKPFVTGTAQPKMNQAKMNSIPVAIPPLAEQRRIVAKVDELMALCDQLEASLASAATDRAQLLEALLQEALAPAA